MKRKIIKAWLMLTAVSALAEPVCEFARTEYESLRQAAQRQFEVNDLKAEREITLPDTVIEGVDTTLVITDKGLLQNRTYIIHISSGQNS